MRVYSWNMYCFNKRQDEALEFINALDYDVLCLQEVPSDFLNKLKTLRVQVAAAVDCERFTNRRLPRQYVVILSKHKIRNPTAIAFKDIRHPIRTKVVIKLMRPVGWTPTKNRNAIRAEIKVGNKTYQIFSVHFTLSSPMGRAREFNAILDHCNHTPAIVAGDFNVLEHPRVKPLSWLLGASLKESSPLYPERRLFEERFAKAKFKNPLLGRVTHGFSQSQLDHVLVSEGLAVTKSGVDMNRYGSDHHPVFVDIHE